MTAVREAFASWKAVDSSQSLRDCSLEAFEADWMICCLVQNLCAVAKLMLLVVAGGETVVVAATDVENKTESCGFLGVLNFEIAKRRTASLMPWM